MRTKQMVVGTLAVVLVALAVPTASAAVGRDQTAGRAVGDTSPSRTCRNQVFSVQRNAVYVYPHGRRYRFGHLPNGGVLYARKFMTYWVVGPIYGKHPWRRLHDRAYVEPRYLTDSGKCERSG